MAKTIKSDKSHKIKVAKPQKTIFYSCSISLLYFEKLNFFFISQYFLII